MKLTETITKRGFTLTMDEQEASFFKTIIGRVHCSTIYPLGCFVHATWDTLTYLKVETIHGVTGGLNATKM